jgi:hypothetical protein
MFFLFVTLAMLSAGATFNQNLIRVQLCVGRVEQRETRQVLGERWVSLRSTQPTN